MQILDTQDQVAEVEDVPETIQLDLTHKMVLVVLEVAAVVVLLISGQIHHNQDVLPMVVVEKLLLDGHNKSKSKNIIWDILQK
jgi:hypothetical protein